MKSKWFEDVFLQSLYSAAGHANKWLTARQTAICTQYMERRTTRIETATGYNNHDNYVYNWDGREVILSYSKKNGCGTIWFGLNTEEQEQARIENEADRLNQIEESARRRLKLHPDRYEKHIESLKAKIKKYQDWIAEDIEDGDTYGIENLKAEICKLQTELAIWQSVA